MKVNARTEEFQHIELFDKFALFRRTVPADERDAPPGDGQNRLSGLQALPGS